MPGSDSSERREFTRLNAGVPVRFKFISSTVKDPAMDQVYEGSTKNISIGGMLLVAQIPKTEWIKDLLVGKILMGVNLVLPIQPDAIKALCRVSWIEAAEEMSMVFRMGLFIQEITGEHRQVLSKYLMRVAAIP